MNVSKFMRRSIVPLCGVAGAGGLLLAPAIGMAQVPQPVTAAPVEPVENEKAQTALLGFLGVKWGNTLEEARALIEQKGGVVIGQTQPVYSSARATKTNKTNDIGSPFLPIPPMLSVVKLPVAGQKAQDISLLFGSDGLYRVTVFFGRQLPTQTTTLYKKIRQACIESYGTPTHEVYQLDAPYTDGTDVGNMRAIMANASVSAAWDFTTPTGSQTIRLSLDASFAPVLVFRDGKRFEKAAAEAKAQRDAWREALLKQSMQQQKERQDKKQWP